MKRLIIVALILIFSTCTVTAFAAGGKNHGTIGKGKTSTGVDSKGTASLRRTGR